MITNQPMGNQDDIREVTDNILKDEVETTAKTTHNGLRKIFGMSSYEQTMLLLSSRVECIIQDYLLYPALERKLCLERSAVPAFTNTTIRHSPDKA